MTKITKKGGSCFLCSRCLLYQCNFNVVVSLLTYFLFSFKGQHRSGTQDLLQRFLKLAGGVIGGDWQAALRLPAHTCICAQCGFDFESTAARLSSPAASASL